MAKKRSLSFLMAIVGLAGLIWLIYDVTVPTLSCREINQTPVQVFGIHGTIKGASPEILGRIFRYRVDIINLSLDWKDYKKAHGENEYVHAHTCGGVTILTDNPIGVWLFIGGDERRLIRKINWPVLK